MLVSALWLSWRRRTGTWRTPSTARTPSMAASSRSAPRPVGSTKLALMSCCCARRNSRSTMWKMEPVWKRAIIRMPPASASPITVSSALPGRLSSWRQMMRAACESQRVRPRRSARVRR